MFRFVFLAFFACCIAAAAIDLPTSQTAIVGSFARGPIDFAVEANAAEFAALFGSAQPAAFPAEAQARQFFRNGGQSAFFVRIDPALPPAAALAGSLQPPALRGLGALLPLSELGLLVCPEITILPPAGRDACLQTIATLGESRPLFTLLDPPPGVTTASAMVAWRQANLPADRADLAIYFPQLLVDPARWTGSTSPDRIAIGASGSVAAVIAQNDNARGIWKAPAGSTAIVQAEGLTPALTTAERDSLNQVNVNSLISYSGNWVVWGARTLASSTEEKYIVVARTRRWIVRSLQRGLAYAALQENDPTLWATLRQDTTAFLYELYRNGAFSGTRPDDAYFVRCDSTTTSSADIAAHRVNVSIGLALIKSAEFSVETITLSTRDAARPLPALPTLISPPNLNALILTYPTAPGFRYTLFSSPTLEANAWSQMFISSGDGRWIRERIPLFAAKKFFRVKTERGW